MTIRRTVVLGLVACLGIVVLLFLGQQRSRGMSDEVPGYRNLDLVIGDSHSIVEGVVKSITMRRIDGDLVSIARVSVDEVLFGPLSSGDTAYFVTAELPENPRLSSGKRVILATYLSKTDTLPAYRYLNSEYLLGQLGGDSSVFLVDQKDVVRPKSRRMVAAGDGTAFTSKNPMKMSEFVRRIRRIKSRVTTTISSRYIGAP
jgi:hypothetical protein